MVLLINGMEFPISSLEEEMFADRARTFGPEGLGWNVYVKNGIEVDQYDDVCTQYLIHIDEETGSYGGSCRLLPSCGPNMLFDLFPFLSDEQLVRSTNTWEASRFCARGHGSAKVELFAAVAEFSVMVGISTILAVFHEPLRIALNRCHVEYRLLGAPKIIGKTKSYAASIPVEQENLDRFRAANFLKLSVMGCRL